MTDSSRQALAFFAPRHRMAEAGKLAAKLTAKSEAKSEKCRRAQENKEESKEGSNKEGSNAAWLVSCQPLSRTAINEAFARGHTIVGWCPPAILIRAIAWGDKQRDSPVLCFPPVAGGQSVLLALSGWHHGGRGVARALQQAWQQVWQQLRHDDNLLVVGGSATEGLLGFSLEDLPQGWTMLGDADSVLKALLSLLEDSDSRDSSDAPKATCEIIGEACGGFPPQTFFDLASKGSKQGEKSEMVKVAVGFRKNEVQDEATDLRLVPRCVTLGVGCVRGASSADIAELVEACLAEANIEVAAVAGIASVSLKRDERGLLQFASCRDLPLRFFTAERLSSVAEQHGLAREEVVARATGTPSVAEAAALALACVSDKADMGERLLLTKRKSAKVTCALALAPCVLVESNLLGEKNGLLTLVGLGPGAACERTSAAARALREAECVVGYGGYIDLLEQGETRAELYRSAIGEEEARCRLALDLARASKRTVLLGSGDAGIYGLATLVWQILAEEEKSNAPVEVRQVSGVSAMHALAARLGAPLGDDFCAVSMSDVMTSETTILQRIKAAAEGDFVTALYNPQSRTRRTLLPRALRLLRAHRPPDTPIACGRLVGRKGESVRVARLHDFEEAIVDMHSVVIVGNSKTKCYASPYGMRLYTERGYTLEGGKVR